MKTVSAEISEIILPHADPRAADRDENPAPLQFLKDFPHAVALDDHAGQPDDIGAGAAVEIDRADILVHDRDAVAGRRQRRDQGQSRRQACWRGVPSGAGHVPAPRYDISNRGLMRTMSAMPRHILFAGDDTLDPFPQLGKDTGLIDAAEFRYNSCCSERRPCSFF